MDTESIQEQRNIVIKVRSYIKAGYMEEAACTCAGTTIKDYRLAVQYLNEHGFNL